MKYKINRPIVRAVYIVYLPSRKMGKMKNHKILALDVVFFMDKSYLMTAYTGGKQGPTEEKRVDEK